MKVHWVYKVIAFAASVMALSGFFAGYRAVHEGQTLSHWALLIGSTAVTFMLLGLQGYWIYIEEKLKGTLRKESVFMKRFIRLCKPAYRLFKVAQGKLSLAKGRLREHE